MRKKTPDRAAYGAAVKDWLKANLPREVNYKGKKVQVNTLTELYILMGVPENRGKSWHRTPPRAAEMHALKQMFPDLEKGVEQLLTDPTAAKLEKVEKENEALRKELERMREVVADAVAVAAQLSKDRTGKN